ncbi:thioredoxin family protein [[Clostridium] colinum]|uniref:thioredoxin family protein n=1 Tax=[Clostridium] colinum TaxID=36835 RepID=UPI0020246C93|nr:thioredoxin family protein [[Clostridium] colinum]
MTVDIESNNYDEYITNNEDLIILDFGATHCAPCKIVNNILEEIEAENKNITVGKVNIEHSPSIAMKYGIMSVPSIVILKNNKIIHKINGLKDKEFIQNLINNI